MNERKKHSLRDTTNRDATNPGSTVFDGMPIGDGSHSSPCENISPSFGENIWLNSPVRLNSIVQGDCLQVLAQVPDEAVPLTICSPPYDTLRSYAGDWSVDFHGLGEQLFRITQPGGIAVVVIADGTKNFAKSLTTARLILDWCDHSGWRLFEHCIYERNGNPGAWWNRRFRVDHENILIFLKGDRPRTFNKTSLAVPCRHAGKVFAGTDRQTNGSMKPMVPKTVNATKCRGTIWPYAASNSEGNRTKLRHPATFPDALARDLIQCFSLPRDVVLDSFCGSGTTCVEAAKAGRNFVGIDISAGYCEIARERLLVEAGVGQVVSGSP